MSISKDLLDKAAKILYERGEIKAPSDYAIWNYFGFHKATVSSWRTGRSQMEMDAVSKLCEVTGDDAIDMFGAIQVEISSLVVTY